MATATLLCKQCNFENEPERVYCHNCGAKLDRALLPPEATKREDPQVVQDRVRSVVRPQRVSFGPLLKKLILSLLVAAVLAALFLASRPPDDQPNLSEDAVLAAPSISDDIEDALQSPGAKRLTYTDDQVNGFLQGSMHAKKATSSPVAIDYERTYVHCEEGLCRATLQQSIFGYSFFISTTDTVQIRNGALVTHPVAGSIGRLQFPAKLMPGVEKSLASLWAPLDVYKKLVARLVSITFHKGSVELVGKAAN